MIRMDLICSTTVVALAFFFIRFRMYTTSFHEFTIHYFKLTIH